MREMLSNPTVQVTVDCEGDLVETEDGLGLQTSVLGTGGVWRNGRSF